MAEWLLFRARARGVGARGRVCACNLNVVDDFLAACVFLRDADCFLAVLRRIGITGQFDALIRQAYADTGEIRILLQGRLNLAGIAGRSHVALRHSRRGTAARCRRSAAGSGAGACWRRALRA